MNNYYKINANENLYGDRQEIFLEKYRSFEERNRSFNEEREIFIEKYRVLEERNRSFNEEREIFNEEREILNEEREIFNEEREILNELEKRLDVQQKLLDEKQKRLNVQTENAIELQTMLNEKDVELENAISRYNNKYSNFRKKRDEFVSTKNDTSIYIHFLRSQVNSLKSELVTYLKPIDIDNHRIINKPTLPTPKEMPGFWTKYIKDAKNITIIQDAMRYYITNLSEPNQ